MNLNSLVTEYRTMLAADLYEGYNVVVTSNSKKVKDGIGSIRITISEIIPDEEMDNPVVIVSASVYIVEKAKSTIILFVNDTNNDIIFNNNSPDAINKSYKYIEQYFKNTVSMYKKK